MRTKCLIRYTLDGYIKIRVNGIWKHEHIAKAEKALGYSLPKGADVHHINEIRHDNRNNNLVICENRAYHLLLHYRMKAYKATGSPLAVFCTHCKQWGMSGENGMVSNKWKSYHRACANVYQNNKRRKHGCKKLHD